MDELINARLARGEEAFALAKIAIERKFWNSAASELYYTSFYSVMALLAKYHIQASTHKGAKTLFHSKFIKEGLIDVKWGKLLSNLFNNRQEGDYGDFIVLTEKDIVPYLKEVEEFRTMIIKLIDKESTKSE